MIYSDDNIHTAIEKLAEAGLAKTAVSADWVRNKAKSRITNITKGKLRGMYVGHKPAAEATLAQLNRIKKLTSAKVERLKPGVNQTFRQKVPGVPGSSTRHVTDTIDPSKISRPGGMKKLKRLNKAKNVDTAITDTESMAKNVRDNKKLWKW